MQLSVAATFGGEIKNLYFSVSCNLQDGFEMGLAHSLQIPLIKRAVARYSSALPAEFAARRANLIKMEK